MTDKPNVETAETAREGDAPAREPYRAPVLVQLGSLRDVTLSTFGGIAADGSRSRKTGRGGRFDAVGCAR
jgi:hypothetical protein